MILKKLSIFFMFPLGVYCLSGSFIINTPNIKTGKQFYIDLAISMNHNEPIALKGAPEIKFPEEIQIVSTKSFSRSGEDGNKIYYRYYLVSQKAGVYKIGPGIVTYLTQRDPAKNDDANLTLAEISEKALQGERNIDSHTFLIGEQEIKIGKNNYFIIALIVFLSIAIIFFLIAFVKVYKTKKRTLFGSVVDNCNELIVDIDRLISDANYISAYEKMKFLYERFDFDRNRLKVIDEKIEGMKFGGHKTNSLEVICDLRAMKLFLKEKGAINS